MIRLNHLKEAKGYVITLVLAAFLLLPSLTVLIVNRQESWLQNATGGLLHPLHVLGVGYSLLVIGGIIIWLGRLRPADIGLDRSKLGLGVLVVLGMWALVQACLLVDALTFREPQLRVVDAAEVGAFLANLVLAGFLEETVFRGFLLPQFYLKLQRATKSEGRWLPVTGAVLASSLLFAGIHIPNGLFYAGQGVEAVLAHAGLATFVGIVFALVYLRTGNLFINIGLHALVNRALPVVEGNRHDAIDYVLLVGVVVLALWPYVFGRRDLGSAPELAGSNSKSRGAV